MKVWVLMACLVSFSVFAQDQYPLETKAQMHLFDRLSRELRCLVCQNQSLADSNAPLALDLRQQVYEKVRAGQSEQVILDYLTKRYGDFILFKPPLKAATWVLWGLPFVLLLLSLFFVLMLTRNNKVR